jgi:hypothetical protein
MKLNVVLGWMAGVFSAAVLAACTAPRGGAAEPPIDGGMRPVLGSGGGGREVREEQPAHQWQSLVQAPAAGSGDSGALAQCAHGVCEAGKCLDPACDPCVADVCAADATCCEEAWEDVCVQYARWFCGECGAAGCSDVPPEGACVGDFAVSCEGDVIEHTDCWNAEEQGRCLWDEAEGRYACVPF